MDPTSRKRYRSIDAICRESGLWPEAAAVDGQARRRLEAIAEVLCRLPPDPFARLRAEPPCFQWDVSDDGLLGQVRLPWSTKSNGGDKAVEPTSNTKVVELSAELEQAPWQVVVTVVVHELAHVILGHAVSEVDIQTHRRQEDEVGQSIREWGFGCEAEQTLLLLAHRALSAGAITAGG